ncbi:MAG TPA: NAD(P)H-hydrate dehydratase [Allosphingosinicella sp.]|nr:NAD(P)H-hydrate dehydratase [Allosphingosinicella sp.]
MSGPVRLDAELLKSLPLPRLAEDGDKEDRGRALIVAGSRELPGAAILAGVAALRAGAGKLQIVTEESVAVAIGIAVPEARVIAGSPLPHVPDAQSVTLGCGMEHGPALDRLLAELLDCETGVPLVLDAAALGCLADREAEVRGRRGGVALLPHSREMARLLECEAEEVEIDPLTAVRRAAKRYEAVALVKGRWSFIAAPDGRAFCFEGGGVGLATSGSGDVLAGLVGGLAARGADALTATLWGVWLHGEAGRILTERVGRVGFLAREIADLVPGLLKETVT